MTIAPALMSSPYLMNEEQSAIVSHKQGPLLITAGPGSGKTRSLILLAMNLLLVENAKPSELVLCTYTEKAAHEMQDLFIKVARAVGYRQDLASLRIGTIHSICKQLITENNHYLPIENDFITLDEFTRHLLICEEIDRICTPALKRFFQERWGSPWHVAKELGLSFDKIAEDLLFEELKKKYGRAGMALLQNDNDRLCAYLTHAYTAYQKLLTQRNCLDFAHLQKCVYNLLCDPKTLPYLANGIRYVFVDEYQDTNYIQEQILTRLASATGDNNLFVVGDEDQALYRFRGATVRNILEFEQKNSDCQKLPLMTNYRSHRTIIETCNTWITSLDWSNPQGIPFRTEKSARSCPEKKYIDYPAVCTILSASIYDEAEQFAELVVSLKKEGKIQDYSQVALLLYSVKPYSSALYVQALAKKEISSFCPRALSYFDHDEVKLMLACFAHILAFEKEPDESEDEDVFSPYLAECLIQLRKARILHNHLQIMLFHMHEEITQQELEVETQGASLLDYFYRLVTVNPFLYSLKGSGDTIVPPHHLEAVSNLLQTFQRYYRYTSVTQQKRGEIACDFFQKFLPLLYRNGWNYDEASVQAFPKGYVPILTIHQAKGLEFPVVVVGRLDKSFNFSENQKHKALQEFSHLDPFEPAARVPNFDLHRLYYVAFSRAKNLLFLMAVRNPWKPLAELWQSLPSWSPAALKDMPLSEPWQEPSVPRPRYGLTNDLQLYMTCPRQFQFFRTYNFTSGQNGAYFSGQLVHHMLEHIHRMARDRKLAELDNEEALLKIFERKFQALAQVYLSSIASEQKTQAWQQILHYLQQNWATLDRVEAAELPVQIDMPKYVLTGTVDLLVETASGVDLIDFKTQQRPQQNSAFLEQYEQQLHFYARAVEQSRGQRPERLFLYWTAEEHKENALMEIPYQAEKMQTISTNLESIAEHIENKHFHVRKPPAVEVCQRCDIRHLCLQDRVIEI